MSLNTILILIIICEIIGLASARFTSLLKSFIFYTQLSNLAALLSAVLLLVSGGNGWVSGFRYLSACMLVMTMLVTIFVLVPAMKDTKLLLFSRVGFFLHLVCPLLNLYSYIFLEPHAGGNVFFLPAAVTLVYGDIMLYLNYRRIVTGPYPFLRFHDQSRTATFLWFLALLGVILGISYGLMSAAG